MDGGIQGGKERIACYRTRTGPFCASMPLFTFLSPWKAVLLSAEIS